MAFQEPPDPAQPIELVLETIRIRCCSLGHVGVEQGEPQDADQDQPRFVGWTTVIEPNPDNLERLSTQHGHPVEPLFPPVHAPVSRLLQGLMGKVLILDFCFLETDDLGFLLLEPAHKQWETSTDSIHIVARHPKPRSHGNAPTPRTSSTFCLAGSPLKAGQKNPWKSTSPSSPKSTT